MVLSIRRLGTYWMVLSIRRLGTLLMVLSKTKRGYCWAGDDCDGVGCVKCVLEQASDIVPQMDDGTQIYKFDCDWPSELE